MNESLHDMPELARQVAHQREQVLTELRKVIVGQDEVVDQVLMSLFCGGHCLITGVPGLAKTLLVSSLARTLDLRFARIQFTPDLMPSDITGTEILQIDSSSGARQFRFVPGPLFANIVLADEINRTPPKTQAALLEAMAERQVTIGTTTHVLGPPFFVMATENPIDMEGTYPLPEAQADRFLLKLRVPRPDRETLLGILDVDPAERLPLVAAKVQRAELLAWQAHVRQLPAADAVREALVDLVERTHPDRVPERFKPYVQLGVSPRGAQALLGAARARAASAGRLHVSLDDVRAMALDVLRHRVLLNFAARAEGVTADTVVSALLAAG